MLSDVFDLLIPGIGLELRLPAVLCAPYDFSRLGRLIRTMVNNVLLAASQAHEYLFGFSMLLWPRAEKGFLAGPKSIGCRAWIGPGIAVRSMRGYFYLERGLHSLFLIRRSRFDC